MKTVDEKTRLVSGSSRKYGSKGYTDSYEVYDSVPSFFYKGSHLALLIIVVIIMVSFVSASLSFGLKRLDEI
uniref:Uncharacterized protein n=1 Tax=Tetranychus urticae TaxID=32264 RepID=T1KBB2_TETUR